MVLNILGRSSPLQGDCSSPLQCQTPGLPQTLPPGSPPGLAEVRQHTGSQRLTHRLQSETLPNLLVLALLFSIGPWARSFLTSSGDSCALVCRKEARGLRLALTYGSPHDYFPLVGLTAPLCRCGVWGWEGCRRRDEHTYNHSAVPNS